jgi:hypothetical protein
MSADGGTAARRRADAAEGELPGALRALVDDVVRAAGLDTGERRDVASELTDHFRDGLAAGTTWEELRGDFGDPRRAARLIGRAKRRCRPAGGRVRAAAFRAAAATTLLLAPPYVASAVRLHSTEPAADGGIEAEVLVVRESVSRARRLAAEARALLAGGDGPAAAERLTAGFEIARTLAARRSLPAELARISVLEASVSATELAAGNAELLGPNARRRLAASLRDQLARGPLGLRADVVGPALPLLLDRVYAAADDGRPSARGLRTLQRLKTGDEPGLRALLLEPLYFVRTARRSDVAPELERLRVAVGLEVSGAGQGVLDAELARLESDWWSAIRSVPVTLLYSRLAGAVRASQRLERAVPRLVVQLEAP